MGDSSTCDSPVEKDKLDSILCNKYVGKRKGDSKTSLLLSHKITEKLSQSQLIGGKSKLFFKFSYTTWKILRICAFSTPFSSFGWEVYFMLVFLFFMSLFFNLNQSVYRNNSFSKREIRAVWCYDAERRHCKGAS